MKMQDFMISLLIIGLVLTGFLGFFSYLNTKYPNPQYVNDGLMEQYQAEVNKTLVVTQETDAQIRNLNAQSGVLDMLNAFFGGAYTAVITAVGSYAMFSSMANIAFAQLGIPNYIVYTILGIVSILLIFMLVRMVTKTE
jgi:hypothetical protein